MLQTYREVIDKMGKVSFSYMTPARDPKQQLSLYLCLRRKRKRKKERRKEGKKERRKEGKKEFGVHLKFIWGSIWVSI